MQSENGIISRLMQSENGISIYISENGILLLFYIFLSHGDERKQQKKRGDAVSCPQVPVLYISLWIIFVSVVCTCHETGNEQR